MDINCKAKHTASEVRQILRDLPAMLEGRMPDRYGFRRTFLNAFGHALLQKINEGYVDKATGGTDSLGKKWPALSPSTTDPTTYWGARRQRLNIHDPNILLLRVRDWLFESLKPGILAGTHYTPRLHQIFQIKRDGLHIGSDLPYFKFHQHGTRKMPPRPVWPEDMKEAHPWVRYATNKASEALAVRLSQVL